MKRKFLLPLILLLATLSAWAQASRERDYITTMMVPNHTDWIYTQHESPEVEISVRRAYCALPNAEVRLEWGPELREPERTWTVNTGKSGVLHLKLTGSKEPGFKTLRAVVTYEGVDYTNTLNLAFQPDKIMPKAVMPKDFQEFWDKAIAAARKVPLKPVVTPRPDCDTEDYVAYEVRFCSDAANRYMYGLMQVPRDGNGLEMQGRMPVVIEWPGAGVKPHRGLKTELSRKGIIVLEMGVNGIPVAEQSDELYLNLRNGALKNYQTIRLDNRDQYYYRSIYVGTVRTIDFLLTLPNVDADRIAVSGGSQGGALSIVNAALDPRVKVASVAYPALCEMAGYVQGRVAGWPSLFKNADKETALAEKVATCGYYDVVNFSRIIKCPIKYFIGYNDRVCCPTSTYSSYNSALRSSKDCQLYVAQDCAHWQYAEHRRLRHEFVASYLSK